MKATADERQQKKMLKIKKQHPSTVEACLLANQQYVKLYGFYKGA